MVVKSALYTTIEARFDEGSHPLIEDMLELRYTTAAGREGAFRTHARQPALVLRLAPLTVTSRWIEWRVSGAAVDSLSTLVTSLAGPDASEPNVLPHPSGFGVASTSARATPWTPRANVAVTKSGTVAVDAGGVLGLRLGFELKEVGGRLNYHRRIGDGLTLAEDLAPLLDLAAEALATEEHLGRYAAQLL